MTNISKHSKKYSIILVDDEEISLKYFYKEFNSKFNIITTTNPEEVLEIIDSRPGEIALVISDQRMGYINGVDLLTLIKSKDQEIVRVLTTAYASLEDNIEAINKGNVFAYLMKPWNMEYVEDVITRSLNEFVRRKNYLNLSSSIASEMRSPLKTASKSAEIIRSKLTNYKSIDGSTGVSEGDLEEIVRLSNDLSTLAKRGNIIIDTILDSFESKSVDTASFRNYKITHILNSIFMQFESPIQKNSDMSLGIKGEDDFELRCNDVLFGYAIYILLTNISKFEPEIKSFEFVVKKGIGGFNRVQILTEKDFDSNILDSFNINFDFGKRVLEDFGGKILVENGDIIIELPKVGRVKEGNYDCKALVLGGDFVLSSLKKNFDMFAEGFDCKICHDFAGGLEEAKNHDYDLILVENKKEFSGFGSEVRRFDSLTAVLSLNRDGEDSLIGEVDGNICIDEVQNKDLRSLAKWGVAELGEKYYDNIDFIESLKGKKILLADDEHFNLILGSKFFVDLGVEVEEARDGLSALESFQSGKYDLALIDINMPNLSGIEVVKKIREIEHIKSLNPTPIVAFTADDDKVRVREILKAGFDDYFIKSTKYNNLAKLMSIYFAN